ncbi:DUF523 domain-containing protein [Nitratifractor sp.]|uniref:DUF523 domain-containing protein n=1 Tax=Nitratifractor sp. TaxID=2268144 RepID=UPI0025D49D0D|nr:DUF523 domain-containing protein [Nitratifractor sp.]
MKKVAISACLLGERCRYDGTDNRDPKLLGKLEGCELVPFCPEDHCFGTPRPTMDLVETEQGVKALSNLTGADLSPCVERYAREFFDKHPDIDLFIGKDRSPSCGVCSARLYDREKSLLSREAAGLMAAEAARRGIECWDSESFLDAHPAPPILGS